MNLDKNDLAAFTSMRRIAHRTHGQTHGPVTRLMSPSDFGEVLEAIRVSRPLDTARSLTGLVNAAHRTSARWLEMENLTRLCNAQKMGVAYWA